MTKFYVLLGGTAVSLILAGCSGTGGLQPGGSITFEPPIQRSCTDDPVASPLPFKPRSLAGFASGSLYISVRYTVQADGSVEDAIVTSIALGDEARALNQRQLDDTREEIPPQIEASWRHSPGRVRVCERALGWFSSY